MLHVVPAFFVFVSDGGIIRPDQTRHGAGSFSCLSVVSGTSCSATLLQRFSASASLVFAAARLCGALKRTYYSDFGSSYHEQIQGDRFHLAGVLRWKIWIFDSGELRPPILVG